MNPGLVAYAAEGLHEQLVQSIERLVCKGSLILDLGAGQGALSARLAGSGYRVVAVDWLEENFRAEGIPFIKVDLDCKHSIRNIATALGEQCDAVVACEVVEHMRHPWQFLEAAQSLLRVDGRLFVSTPNPASASSRVNLLLNGTANGFGANRKVIGHISPLFPTQMRDMFESIGMENVKITGAGHAPFLRERSLRGIIQGAVTLGLRLFMRDVLNGPCMLATGRKGSSVDTGVEVRPSGVGAVDAYSSEAA